MSTDAVRRIRAFNRYYTNLIGVLDRHILKSPWSLTEVRILFEISRDEGTNARRLKSALSVDEGYLSRTIERLAADGMVSRSRSASDGRVVHLRLSARGRAEMEKLEAAAAAEIQSILDPLSREEISEVVSCMRRIEALLGKGGEEPA
jgi:DNA-binding MarR family transcriptional regulator